MTDRLNDIIAEAQRRSGAPRNTKAIVAQMLHGELWDQIIGDMVIHKSVMRLGLDQRVSGYIKHLKKMLDDLESMSVTEPMLALWPEEVRQTVKNIDRAAVFVPSAGQYVDMLPDEIDPEQAIEAGRYLITHGEDAIRRGELLIQLGEAGGW